MFNNSIQLNRKQIVIFKSQVVITKKKVIHYNTITNINYKSECIYSDGASIQKNMEYKLNTIFTWFCCKL